MGSGKGKQRRARVAASSGTTVITNMQTFDDFVASQGIGDVRVADYYSARNSYEVAGRSSPPRSGVPDAIDNWMTALAGELFRDLVSIGTITLSSQLDVDEFVFTVGV